MTLTLQPGSTLLHYKVVAPLGAGGMGEVYRAVDTTLGREVAIKVLPSAFSSDPERLARFEREARLLASLNHPNIAAVYGLHELAGNRFLAMELVPGESLAARLERGALPVDEALAVARRIADALAAAHEKGVIHRDLKPANVQVFGDNGVKVLDFGLAKGLEPQAGGSGDLAHSPTLTFGATVEGVILGTAAYMSPEQARGRAVDRRADVWAFGCLLWEMLTGRRLFGGETVSDTIASVLRGEPDWGELPEETPHAVRRLLRRCLERDPAKRLRDLGDARLDLDEPAPAPVPPAVVAAIAAPRRALSRLPWVMAAASLALALAVVGWALSHRGVADSAPRERPLRFAVVDPPLAPSLSSTPRLALSPDGERLFWITERDGKRALVVRALGGLDAQIVPGSDGVQAIAAVARDGERVAVVRDQTIEWLALRGGAPDRQARSGVFRGAALAADGALWLSPSTETGIVRAPHGQAVEPLIHPDAAAFERTFRWPVLLPGDEVVLYTVASAKDQTFAEARIEAYSTRTRKRTVVVERASYALFRAPDRLYFVRSGGLFETRLDLARLTLASEPRLVMENVGDDLLAGVADVAIAEDGTLAFAPGGTRTIPRRLVEIGRDGATRAIAPEAEPYQRLRVSPDGRTLAVDIDAAGAQLWLIDRDRGTRIRLTNGWSNNYPLFSHDGQSVIYASARGAGPQFWRQRLDGSAPVAFYQSEVAIWPLDISPDGRRLLFFRLADAASSDLWELPLDGSGEARPLVESPYNEPNGRYSPDGRWLAFASDESGRYEVYLQPVPGPGRKVRVSSDGGGFPLWNPDGREIVYRSLDGFEILAARVTLVGEATVERPRRWAKLDAFDFWHEMLPDGKLAVVLDPGEPAPPPIIVARGWDAAPEK